MKWSYGEVLGDKSVMCIRMILYRGYVVIFSLFHLGIPCTCFVLCGCVCVDSVMCVLVICALAFTVFLVLFRLCIFIFICFVCTSVRTTATE